MTTSPLGLLIMAYGTPSSLDQVEAYYTHIRRGRPPTPELLADLIRRYQAIGGVSPLTQITRAQAEGIEAAVNALGVPCKAYLGMKHASPFIADAVAEMVEDGIKHAITLVLAPHYSTMSVGAYQQTAEEAAAAQGGPTLHHIDNWHLDPGFIKVLARHVEQALLRFPDGATPTVVFSAHSLPARILAQGDPYERQLHETGEAVTAKLGLQRVTYAWQSAGRTNEPWLGPDILEVIRTLAAEGVRDIVSCPAGFVSDHLEVLYDLDIDCAALARELGVRFVRTQSLNTDQEFLKALANVVYQKANSTRE
ncbi:MAG: ferrochelatase [Alicyclobacillus sp.]|nr:ferrochelatase [Alicyclobacillus sp.]